MKLLPAVCLVLFLFAGLSAQAQDKATVKAEIEKINNEITSLLRAKKFTEASEYYAPDLIQMVSGQPPITSRAAWIATQEGGAQIGDWDLQLEVLDVEFSGDMVVERGRGVNSFTANDKSPMPSFEMIGDYMALWKKVDGKWMIQWDYVVLQQPPE